MAATLPRSRPPIVAGTPPAPPAGWPSHHSVSVRHVYAGTRSCSTCARGAVHGGRVGRLRAPSAFGGRPTRASFARARSRRHLPGHVGQRVRAQRKVGLGAAPRVDHDAPDDPYPRLHPLPPLVDRRLVGALLLRRPPQLAQQRRLDTDRVRPLDEHPDRTLPRVPRDQHVSVVPADDRRHRAEQLPFRAHHLHLAVRDLPTEQTSQPAGERRVREQQRPDGASRELTPPPPISPLTCELPSALSPWRRKPQAERSRRRRRRAQSLPPRHRRSHHRHRCPHA